MIVGIRHAQVWNPDGVVYARLAGFHLSDQGRADARELAAAVAPATLSAIYASPLERAVAASLLLGSGGGLAAFHTTHLPHLGCVRLRPGPPEVVDLPALARSC